MSREQTTPFNSAECPYPAFFMFNQLLNKIAERQYALAAEHDVAQSFNPWSLVTWGGVVAIASFAAYTFRDKILGKKDSKAATQDSLVELKAQARKDPLLNYQVGQALESEGKINDAVFYYLQVPQPDFKLVTDLQTRSTFNRPDQFKTSLLEAVPQLNTEDNKLISTIFDYAEEPTAKLTRLFFSSGYASFHSPLNLLERHGHFSSHIHGYTQTIKTHLPLHTYTQAGSRAEALLVIGFEQQVAHFLNPLLSKKVNEGEQIRQQLYEYICVGIVRNEREKVAALLEKMDKMDESEQQTLQLFNTANVEFTRVHRLKDQTQPELLAHLFKTFSHFFVVIERIKRFNEGLANKKLQHEKAVKTLQAKMQPIKDGLTQLKQSLKLKEAIAKNPQLFLDNVGQITKQASNADFKAGTDQLKKLAEQTPEQTKQELENLRAQIQSATPILASLEKEFIQHQAELQIVIAAQKENKYAEIEAQAYFQNGLVMQEVANQLQEHIDALPEQFSGSLDDLEKALKELTRYHLLILGRAVQHFGVCEDQCLQAQKAGLPPHRAPGDQNAVSKVLSRSELANATKAGLPSAAANDSKVLLIVLAKDHKVRLTALLETCKEAHLPSYKRKSAAAGSTSTTSAGSAGVTAAAAPATATPSAKADSKSATPRHPAQTPNGNSPMSLAKPDVKTVDVETEIEIVTSGATRAIELEKVGRTNIERLLQPEMKNQDFYQLSAKQLTDLAKPLKSIEPIKAYHYFAAIIDKSSKTVDQLTSEYVALTEAMKILTDMASIGNAAAPHLADSKTAQPQVNSIQILQKAVVLRQQFNELALKLKTVGIIFQLSSPKDLAAIPLQVQAKINEIILLFKAHYHKGDILETCATEPEYKAHAQKLLALAKTHYEFAATAPATIRASDQPNAAPLAVSATTKLKTVILKLQPASAAAHNTSALFHHGVQNGTAAVNANGQSTAAAGVAAPSPELR